MPRAWRLASVALASLMAVGLASPARAVHLRGQLLRVGFTGSGSNEGEQGIDCFRIGTYTPILIELTNDDADTFTGTIEARQADRDGDEVIARREVMFSGMRRYYLYVPGGGDQDHTPFSVRVLDKEGGLTKLFNDSNQPVPELMPAMPPRAIENESRVVLDISEVNRLKDLVRNHQLNRPVTVLRVSAKELPDDPAGLEMADTIVWDGGDPGDMQDLSQYQALLEWTRRGGRLVIGVSRNWQQLNGKFGDILPAKLNGTATMGEVNSKWAEVLFGGFAAPFDPPLPYCPLTLASLAPGAIPIIPSGVESEGQPSLGPKDPILAVRRPLGRGEVILVAAELRELTDPKRRNNIQADALFRRLVGLRSETKREDERDSAFRHDLFSYVKQQTGFQVMTQLYLLFAFIFVVGYVAVATGGSWLWLKKRKLPHYAWVVFAAVALVASVASLAAVHLVRGIGFKVQELAFVDMEAGSSDAAAVVYFGLKTPTHTTLDLRLGMRGRPADDLPNGMTMLRPLPVDTSPLGVAGGKYRAGQRYEALAAAGELREVPLRATLKQFEGVWRGTVGGQLAASIRRQRGELDPNSWIRNDLGADLDKCYLLVPISSSSWPDRPNMYEVRCYYLGKLPNGRQISLGDTESEQIKVAGVAPDGKPQRLFLGGVNGIQSTWLQGFGAHTDPGYGGGAETDDRLDLGRLNDALMLVSTFDEINRDMRVQVERSQGQGLDRSLALTRRMGLLIGFSTEPGPAVLCWRRGGSDGGREKWKPLNSEGGRTVMYRVGIPVE